MILGIDPGLEGAFALVSEDGALAQVWDMPTKKDGKRNRIDPLGLMWLARRIQAVYEPETWVIEKVGGRPRQSAAAAFVFGLGYGMIIQLAYAHEVRLEQIPPQTWKKAMRVSADKDVATWRAEELFPQQRSVFRTPKGKPMHDRAEAAMMALYMLEQRK